MLIIIAMILVMIGAQILSWLYATINPFIDQLWNIQRYNTAYYGAISSVERAYLTLRWHEAWFEWSWWRIGTKKYWHSSDYQADIRTRKYRWTLVFDNFKNWMTWNIKSMTDWTVPRAWAWNLDSDISSWNNSQVLWFGESLQYAFYKDTSDKDRYYRKALDSDIKNIKINKNLKFSINLPHKLAKSYNADITKKYLDTKADLDDDTIKDDVIVNWSLFGYTWDSQFTIFPTMDVVYASSSADWKVNLNDTTIRESDVNHGTIVFNTINGAYTNPSDNRTWNPSNFNQSPIDSVATGFKNVLDTWVWRDFGTAKANGKISKMNLKLSLVNFLKNSDTNIYPYLEVKLDTAWDRIPWLEYDITGRWRVWEYDVKILLQKPIFKTSAASDFTVLF